MLSLSIIKTGEVTDLLTMSDDDIFDLTNVSLSYNQLQDKHILMYLASNTFDILNIEIDDELDEELIGLIASHCKTKNIKMCSKDKDTLNLLISIYPEKEAKLKHAYLLKKDLMSIVNKGD